MEYQPLPKIHVALGMIWTACVAAVYPASARGAGEPVAIPVAIPASKAAYVVRPEAEPFRLQDVKLLDGPFKHSQDVNARYMLSLDPDRLVARFRSEAGLPAKAEPYPGWETNTSCPVFT